MASKRSLEYTNKYTSFTREEIIEDVTKTMSEKRMEHVLRVEETALQLAGKYNADLEKVSLAALIHDIAKQQDDSEMRDIIISENLDLDLLQYGDAIWHGPVGAVLARRQFGIEDEEILDGIAHHTIAAPEMTLVEQIIFVADYIEPGREFDGVKKARELAEESLEAVVKYQIRETIRNLILEEERIYPKAIDSYNAWITK
jgi:predicted HD superfamily hydrolase involved in NAD metabolism